ncbi:MAG: ribonuclease Z [Flavobacterium sp.]|nr:MAG: ribonuclease Z [Flavobacterium sp.]
MKVEEKGHTVIIRDTQGNAFSFLQKVQQEHNTFLEKNLILDISLDSNVTLKTVTEFVPLSKLHRKAKKSFVLVVPEINYNALPASLVVVPSMLEAHDVIEMEEIERDLGF